jgi:hypothetical protein
MVKRMPSKLAFWTFFRICATVVGSGFEAEHALRTPCGNAKTTDPDSSRPP